MVSRPLTILIILFSLLVVLTACGDTTIAVSSNTPVATTAAITTTAPTSQASVTSSASQDDTIAPYAGFKSANLGVLERGFNQNLKESAFGLVDNLEINYYLLSEPADKALAYYKTEAAKRNFREASNQEVATLPSRTISYIKLDAATSKIIGMVYFQLDETTKMQVQYGEGKVGDYVFIVFGGNLKTSNSASTDKLQKHSGSGDKSLSLALPKGIIRVKADYKGSQNFSVELLYSSGQRAEQPINVMTSYIGVSYVAIYESNNYSLSIKSTGEWSVEVANNKELETESATPLEQRYTGQGDSVLKVKSARTGPIDFELAHSGSKSFIVTVYDKNGTPIEVLANKTGAYTGTTKVRLQAADYYIGIKADGTWDLQVR